MTDGNLYSRLAARFTATAPFIRASGVHDASYDSLHRRSAQWARALCALGVVPGDRIAQLAVGLEDTMRLHGPDVSTQDIGREVLERLRDLDEVAYLRFASVYRSFSSAEDFEREIEALRAHRITTSG